MENRWRDDCEHAAIGLEPAASCGDELSEQLKAPSRRREKDNGTVRPAVLYG
ncbi:MAG: hypothetical protein ABI896_11250 [Actinomycetota bacterium]